MFLEFLNENAKKKLVLDYSKLGLKELEDEDLDYFRRRECHGLP